MAYIYLITNDINGKQYIGKTYNTIKNRWKEHCQDYKKDKNEKRPLYNAMNKYGIEHFHIQEIEFVSQDKNLEEREIYWINYYNTYHNGYNATYGGDGKCIINHQKVIELYQQLQNQQEVANIMNIHPDSVSNILKSNQIKTKSSQAVIQQKYSKKVSMYDLNNNYIQTFNSMMEAAQYLIDNQLTNCKKDTIRTHISEVCRGKRKTAAKFIWKFQDN